MSVDTMLAHAVAESIFARLHAGAGFLRVPEAFNPFPVHDILENLAGHGDIRIGVFIDDWKHDGSSPVRVTTDVPEVIDWRNDASVADALVIFGNLERDRAAGLADVETIPVTAIKRQLFQEPARQLRDAAVSQPAQKLVRALNDWNRLTDLRACADYLLAILPPGPASALRAREELWRVGLLPDGHDGDIDRRRLEANAALVDQLRRMDASTRQRLIRYVSAQGGVHDYTPLRLFASTGDPQHLAKLRFDAVLQAVKATTKDKGKNNANDDIEVSDSGFEGLISPDFDEQSFLLQIAEPSNEDTPIVVGELRLTDWSFDSLEAMEPLLSDCNDDGGYPDQSGSVEMFADAAHIVEPGKGQVLWRRLSEISLRLRKLESERAKRSECICAEAVDRIAELRANLDKYRTSILTEGLRLFLASPMARTIASDLVQGWVDLWRALEQLRRELPPGDHVYLRRVAEELATCDLRVTVHRGDVNAYVLPLHPLVLEPRVRAAQLFVEGGVETSPIFDLIAGSLDPSVPSISVLREGSPISVGYAGQFKGALHYSKRPRQVDSADVLMTLRQLVQRFSNVHPYAKLSLAVGVVNPPHRTAKNLLKWLAEGGVSDRVLLTAFTTGEDADALRVVLDEAREELVNGEISARSFDFDVVSLNGMRELPTRLRESNLLPHLLFMFDVADIEQSTQGASPSTPPLGSLITEWDFDTDPLEDSRPIIRPRSGSDQLTSFLEAQAGLFDTSLPTQQRSPLLSKDVSGVLEELAELSTWIVLCEGVSSLVPPFELGDLQLVGRFLAGTHVAFVYSAQILLLVEPVLAYLQQSTWIAPDEQSAVKFLLGSVRLALPEGLLGFFKAQGLLSKESVLGRLGLAAAVAYLRTEDPNQLIVSLDTDGARRWLNLREGSDKRADLIVLKPVGGDWVVEPIEVKARSDEEPWGTSGPSSVKEALGQVRVMERLLQQVLDLSAPEPFTPSRREILKRQVFLEALQQWEETRLATEGIYRERLLKLNRLFNREAVATVSPRLFLVTSTQSTDEEIRAASDEEGSVPVVALGVPWLRRALEQQPGAVVEIPVDFLDGLGVDFGGLSNEDTEISSGGVSGTDESVTGRLQEDLPTERVDEQAAAGTTEGSSEDVAALASHLRDAFIARQVPFVGVEADEATEGPSIIRIPFTVRAGAKLASVQAQESDLARDLGLQAVRIANWQGRPGFAFAELPRHQRVIPDVSSLVLPDDAREYPTLALGARDTFEPEWASLDYLPHLLVAGTTGSGKSVFLRSILWQLTRLYGAPDLDLVLIDAKGLADYLDFSDAPHFKATTDFHTGVSGALDLLEDIVGARLPERSNLFTQYARSALARPTPSQVTNLRQLLADSRESGAPTTVRPLVVVIDEFAELVMASSDRKRFETLVTRFVQKARAVGGHLIAATQRPSTDVVTGLMKSNFARVALRVQQSVDSRVILDENGAESLLGRGDLLYKSLDAGLLRLQGYSAIGPYLTAAP